MQLNPTWTISPLFEGVRDEENLRAWLMRVYFNPTKHSQEIYFKPDISKENVLEYISHSGNKFPQTPSAIREVWSLLPGLREGLKSVNTDEPVEKGGNYIKGEMTLADIGQVLGSSPITAAMVNKISDTAVLKISAMLKALGSDNKWLAQEAEDKIDNAKMVTAGIFADALTASQTVSEVIEKVTQSKLVSLSDANLVVDDTEKEAFQNLLDLKGEEDLSREDFIEIFEEDLSKTVNVFNLAQLCVSRQVFPQGKRGRRKGSVNAE